MATKYGYGSLGESSEYSGEFSQYTEGMELKTLTTIVGYMMDD